MKKILVLIALIASVFLLVACSQVGEPPIGDKVKLREVYVEGGSRPERPMTENTYRKISFNSAISPNTGNVQTTTVIPSSNYIFIPVTGRDGKDSVKLIVQVINPEDHDITRIFIKATDAEGKPVRMFIEEELATGDINKIDIDEGRRGIRWNGSSGEIASYSVSLDGVMDINYVSLEIVKMIYINSETDKTERVDLGEATNRIVDIFMINTYFEIDYGMYGETPSIDNGILKFNISYFDPLGIIEKVEIKIFDDELKTHISEPILIEKESGRFNRRIEIDINDIPGIKAVKYAYLDVKIILNDDAINRLSDENIILKQIFESTQFIDSLNKKYGATGPEGESLLVYNSEMTFHLAIDNQKNNEFSVYYRFQYLDNNMLVDLRDKNLEIVIRDSETNEEILRLNDIFNNITESRDERRIYSTEDAEIFKVIKSKHELLMSLEGTNVTIEVQLFDGKTYIRDMIIDKESIIHVEENGIVVVYTKNLPI